MNQTWHRTSLYSRFIKGRLCVCSIINQLLNVQTFLELFVLQINGAVVWIALCNPPKNKTCPSPSTHALWTFSFKGPLPLVSKGTHIIIPLVEELQDLCWEAKVVEQNANRVNLSINSLPNAVIGKYKLTVSTQSTESGPVNMHDPEKDVYMLFNPWCKGEICKEILANNIFHTGIVFFTQKLMWLNARINITSKSVKMAEDLKKKDIWKNNNKMVKWRTVHFWTTITNKMIKNKNPLIVRIYLYTNKLLI